MVYSVASAGEVISESIGDDDMAASLPLTAYSASHAAGPDKEKPRRLAPAGLSLSFGPRPAGSLLVQILAGILVGAVRFASDHREHVVAGIGFDRLA